MRLLYAGTQISNKGSLTRETNKMQDLIMRMMKEMMICMMIMKMNITKTWTDNKTMTTFMMKCNMFMTIVS